MKLIYETNSDISICDPLHCYPEEKIVFEEEKFHKVFSADEAVKENARSVKSLLALS